jgi:hypothetical protein
MHGGSQNHGVTKMSNVDWQNGATDRSRTSLPDSYKPKALLPDAYKPKALRLAPADDAASPEMDPPIVDLRKLEEELGRRRIDEIADVVRALTYGEMMELAASMWSVRPDGSNLTEHNLPGVLYRWSTLRQS